MLEESSVLPKVLVISHNCFSKSGSNGRTLKMFFEDYPKEKLAQLFVVNEIPDEEQCGEYYRITDMDIVKSMFRCTSPGTKVSVDEKRSRNEQRAPKRDRGENIIQKIKASTSSLLIREWIWRSPLWKKKQINDWIEKFNPEIVLFQAGNLGYLCRFSEKIAEKYNIPLIVYNSEGYFFKKYNYVKGTLRKSVIFDMYQRIFRKNFSNMMRNVDKAIYISEELKNAYDKAFSCESYYIMTATTNSNLDEKKEDNETLRISYLGNLGLGRYKSIIEIGKALQNIDKKFFIDVYGIAPNKEVLVELKKAEGVNYKGFISYDQVLDIINNSDINVHVEGFESFYIEDSKFAFSTKIADLLASGKTLFLYAPDNLTSTKYIVKNQCGCVVTQKKDLKNKLEELIYDKELRENYIEKAKIIVKKNHDIEENRKKFQQILIESKR